MLLSNSNKNTFNKNKNIASVNISNISPSDSGVYTFQATTPTERIQTTIKINAKSNKKYIICLIAQNKMIFKF